MRHFLKDNHKFCWLRNQTSAASERTKVWQRLSRMLETKLFWLNLLKKKTVSPVCFLFLFFSFTSSTESQKHRTGTGMIGTFSLPESLSTQWHRVFCAQTAEPSWLLFTVRRLELKDRACQTSHLALRCDPTIWFPNGRTLLGSLALTPIQT